MLRTPPAGTWAAGGTTELKGTIAAASGSGTLDIAVSATYATKGGDAGPDGGTGSTATATLVVGGSTVTLTGTFDPSRFTGPSGTGTWSAIPTTGGTATSHCGTYSGPDSGTWTFTVSTTGNLLGAYYSSVSGKGGALSGSVSGSSVTIVAGSGGGATGSISGTTASGTYGSRSTSGTWTGTQC